LEERIEYEYSLAFTTRFPAMTRNQRADALAPRKAPTQRRAAATVEAILEAAARILETQGLEGYTTNAVAERAGVSIGSLYQYFPNRDPLTAALIERETATLLEQAGEAAQGGSCAEVLAGLIEAAVAHQMRRPALARIVDFEEQRLPMGERNQRVADVLQRIIDDAPAVPDRQQAAQDVLAIAHGMIDAAGQCGETDAEDLRLRVEMAVRGYLVGMASGLCASSALIVPLPVLPATAPRSPVRRTSRRCEADIASACPASGPSHTGRAR
jgi:AcrR family transcriptional regulator